MLRFRSRALALLWHTNGHNGVSNHQFHDCLLNRLFRRRSKTSKLHVTGLCEGNSPVIGEFPIKVASNAEMFPFDDVIIGKLIKIATHPTPNAGYPYRGGTLLVAHKLDYGTILILYIILRPIYDGIMTYWLVMLFSVKYFYSPFTRNMCLTYLC